MISVTVLKRHLGVSGSTDDTLLEELEASAVKFFERETSRWFSAAATYTAVIIGNGTSRLWLPGKPDDGTIPATVTERKFEGSNEETIAEGDDDGYVMRTGDSHLTYLLRKTGLVWRKGWEYEFAYERGYTATTVPEDVQQAVIDLVSLGYEDAKKGGTGPVKSERLGDYSYTLAEPTTDESTSGLGDRAARIRHTINNWRVEFF